MTFYLTFGQKNRALSQGWIEVEAVSYEQANHIVKSIFGEHWANLYAEEKFTKTYFPDGKIGRTIK